MKKIVLAVGVQIMALMSPSVMAASAGPYEELAAFIRKTKTEIAPASGTAVAVVKGGKIVYEGYFGFSDVEETIPVARNTSFYIASTTKPFFALNVLLQAEAGTLDIRASLQDMFPDIRFKGFDANAVTVKDLLVHTSGVDNQPLVWATAFSGVHDAKSRRDLVAASYPDTDAKPGSFRYSNVGYNITSVWLDRKLAMRWQDQLEASIFKPLGMKHTSAHISSAEAKKWPLAKPYSFASGDPNAPLYLRKTDNTMQAAGGLVSTAPDLAKFLIAQLGQGKYRGRQVFPASTIAQSHVPQVVLNASYLDFKRTGYAWGWYTGEYKGKTMLHHFGSFAGFHAHLSFIPEENIGLVVLNNEDVLSSRMTSLIADYVYGVLLEEPDIRSKLSARFDELRAKAGQTRAATVKNRSEIQARKWQMSQPLEAYVGKYSNTQLGEIMIELDEKKQLRIRWGNLDAIANAYDRPDHVRVEFSPNSGDILSFEVNDGVVGAVLFADARFDRSL